MWRYWHWITAVLLLGGSIAYAQVSGIGGISGSSNCSGNVQQAPTGLIAYYQQAGNAVMGNLNAKLTTAGNLSVNAMATGTESLTTGEVNIGNAKFYRVHGTGILTNDSTNTTLRGGGSQGININPNNTTAIHADTSANLQMPGGITLGSSTALTVGVGELGLAKITASTSAPGAAGGKLELVCGTNAGSAKLIAFAGTSATAVTVLDNIGSGVTGC